MPALAQLTSSNPDPKNIIVFQQVGNLENPIPADHSLAVQLKRIFSVGDVNFLTDDDNHILELASCYIAKQLMPYIPLISEGKFIYQSQFSGSKRFSHTVLGFDEACFEDIGVCALLQRYHSDQLDNNLEYIDPDLYDRLQGRNNPITKPNEINLWLVKQDLNIMARRFYEGETEIKEKLERMLGNITKVSDSFRGREIYLLDVERELSNYPSLSFYKKVMEKLGLKDVKAKFGLFPLLQEDLIMGSKNQWQRFLHNLMFLQLEGNA